MKFFIGLFLVFFCVTEFAYAQLSPSASTDTISCGGRTRPASGAIILNAQGNGSHQTFKSNGSSYLTTRTINCWCVRSHATSGSGNYLEIGHGTAAVDAGAAPAGATYFTSGTGTIGAQSSLGIEGQSYTVRKEVLVQYSIATAKYPFAYTSAANTVFVEMICY